MAIFHLTLKNVSRGKGQSAVAKAAYNAREELTNEATGEEHDYTRAEGLIFKGIFAPKDAPEWANDRESLWSEVEKAETRKNSRVAREIEIGLPYELTEEQRRQLVTDFVRENFVRHGLVADVAIHAPDREGDDRNHHAHLLLTTRQIGPEGFGAKLRKLEGPEQLETWRENWARTTNRYLERHGHDARIDHRSLEAQGIDREPTTHRGPTATQMEREGERSERGDVNRDIEARNREREQAKAEREQIVSALHEAVRAKAREAMTKEDWEKWQRDDLSRLQGEIRLSYSLSQSAEGFALALEEKGLILTRAAAEDVQRSETIQKLSNHVADAPERIALQEGAYYVVGGQGQVYALNLRTTGDSKNEIQKHLATLDQDTILNVGDAQEVMREVREHRQIERDHKRQEMEQRNTTRAALSGCGSLGMESQQRAAMRRIERAHMAPQPMHPDEFHEKIEEEREHREKERRAAAQEITSPHARDAEQRRREYERTQQEEQVRRGHSSFASRKDDGQQKREEQTARTEQTETKQRQMQKEIMRELFERQFGKGHNADTRERWDSERERER